MKLKVKHYILSFSLVCLLITTYDIVKISTYDLIPSLPKNKEKQKINDIYFQLDHGESEINWNDLNPTLGYINNQYDVADFRLATLVRLVYDFPQSIPDSVKQKIKDTFFNFRYWMDEPGTKTECAIGVKTIKFSSLLPNI